MLKAYKSCKGDMSAVMDTVVMASQGTDISPRSDLLLIT